MTSIALEISGLEKRFGDKTAVHNLTLQVREGEILALVGPSGCGKTTLLRLVAGLEEPDAGEIRLQGKPAVDNMVFLPPERRGVGMVFQDYALFPHISVAGNIGFGLNGTSRDERKSVVERMLQLVGLSGYEDRYPHELSGGERQRVALARALAPQPVVLLLDEPFSNLDADRRIQMRMEVREILKRIGATAIFVTHDQEEALYIGDRLAVLNEGRLEQVDYPETVFHRPSTRFVADFMGETFFIPGRVRLEGIETEIGLLSQAVNLPPETEVEVAVRGDDIGFQPSNDGRAVIAQRFFKGAYNVYCLELPSGLQLQSMQPHTYMLAPGTPVKVFVDAGHSLACYYNGRLVE